MTQETFVVGSREFTCVRMNAFAANKLLMRLQKVLMPIVGSLLGDGKSTNLMEVDVKEAARMIAENLDESVMDTIILPLFSESRLYCNEQKKYIKDAVSIDQCFTTENLFDLYELAFVVGRYQFGPFFASVIGRFGSQLAAQPKE